MSTTTVVVLKVSAILTAISVLLLALYIFGKAAIRKFYKKGEDE